jgi:hypothetical protein
MNQKSNKFYCFSPPVMVVTMLAEVTLFLYTLLRYKMAPITRVITFILLFLATFQLAEFNVCGGRDAKAWSHIGFIAITILPALGIHLISLIAKRKNTILKSASYLVSGLFAIIFGLSGSDLAAHACGGNYAIFQLAHRVGGMYFAYYYLWLFIGIGLSLYYSIKATVKIRQALVLQIVGYLSFLLPTGIVNTINPKTIEGLPSIMCGFAVIYAFILVFGIVPLTITKRNIRKA